LIPAVAAAAALHLIPRPQSVTFSCAHTISLARPLRVAQSIDRGALALINERWQALGIPLIRESNRPDIRVHAARLPPQAYAMRVQPDGTIGIEAADADGAFYAFMTLAQLPQRTGGAWSLPCVEISDAPALRWRILSDDVSRGPLPTMRYFKERIRTLAAFKMNGYSPYMEHVFIAPQDPLPAPLDGITPAQLGELAQYARRFHVAFIPEQQTFAHMHNTLAVERYAGAADLPHAFLLSPASPISVPYIKRVIDAELAAVPHPPFFHIGSDETSTLGLGQTAALVRQYGLTQVYAAHINAMHAIVAPSGARIMVWDDGIEKDPSIMPLIPRSTVVVNWHYGDEATFMPYISLVARGGFDQMVAPGARNWNEIYPDIHAALANEERFISEGKRAGVLGLFQTVWHDDGESLYEATWYPVLFAAANVWQRSASDGAAFRRDFSAAFFGSDDSRFAGDVATLADIESRVTADPEDSSDYLFWADPFDQRIAARMQKVDLRAVRIEAENVEQHLLQNAPLLHRNAARVMYLAARRFDLLGRKFQAAQEIRDYYADAQRNAGMKDSPSLRDLFWCKYWFWELRDGYEALAPLYERAWRYENRESHLASNLERYHLAAQQNIARAAAVDAATYEDYVRLRRLPPLESVLQLR